MTDIPADVMEGARALFRGLSMNERPSAEAIALALLEARAEGERAGAERMREAAAQIVSAARFGEIDGDLRSVFHAIRALPVPEPAKEEA